MSVDEAVPAQNDNQPVKKKITLEDCKLHNKEEDCWLVISGKVYDVTEFLDEHPGGFDIVLAATGNSWVTCLYHKRCCSVLELAYVACHSLTRLF